MDKYDDQEQENEKNRMPQHDNIRGKNYYQ